VLTGGVGHEQLREFYSRHFIPKMPADTEIVPSPEPSARERLVDEMIFSVTHTIEMDWMLPGIAPTGKRVNVRWWSLSTFATEKLSKRHIYWIKLQCLCNSGF